MRCGVILLPFPFSFFVLSFFFVLFPFPSSFLFLFDVFFPEILLFAPEVQSSFRPSYRNLPFSSCDLNILLPCFDSCYLRFFLISIGWTHVCSLSGRLFLWCVVWEVLFFSLVAGGWWWGGEIRMVRGIGVCACYENSLIPVGSISYERALRVVLFWGGSG